VTWVLGILGFTQHQRKTAHFTNREVKKRVKKSIYRYYQ